MKDHIECQICGQGVEHILDQQFQLNYYRCKNCEFIKMDPNHRLTHEDEKREYDRHNNTIENEGYVNMFRDFLGEGILPYVKQGRGLDFGSGPEPVLTQLIEREYPYEMDHYDVYFQPEKIYEGKTYDFIVSTEVFEHLSQPKKTLGELSKLLVQGGIISLMTLFHHNDDDHFQKWWYRRDVTHICFFTVRTFEVLAPMCGLRLLHTDGKRIITLERL